MFPLNYKIVFMKSLLFVFVMLFSAAFSWSQQPAITTTNETHFFAQCLLQIDDQAVFQQLETDLRLHPNAQVVRLDWNTKRVFLLTKDLLSFDEASFLSWLGTYATQATCIQVGLHGVDPINRYPFTNCETH
jgi:hypothetical protein